MRQPGDLMNSCGKRCHELDLNDDCIIKKATNSCNSTLAVAKIRLVVVVAYTVSDFIVILGICDADFKYWLLTKNGSNVKTFPAIFACGFAAVSPKLLS